MATYEKGEVIDGHTLPGGWVADDADHCANCGEQFEIEAGEDEDGHKVPHVEVPVECDKGNFCSEQCRMQAAYAQAEPEMQKAMRRVYLGATLLSDAQGVMDYLNGWEVWPDNAIDPADSVVAALSPDGGVLGKPGVEDDCEALLLPQNVRGAVWEALYDARRAWTSNIADYENHRANCEKVGLSTSLWDVSLGQAQASLASLEAALKAFEGLEKIA